MFQIFKNIEQENVIDILTILADDDNNDYEDYNSLEEAMYNND